MRQVLGRALAGALAWARSWAPTWASAWALFGALVAIGGVGCRATVLDGLDEAEANDLVTALDAAGFRADKVSRGGRHAVDVERVAFADAWIAARASGFPRPIAPAAASGLVATADERHAALRRANEAAVAAVLRADPAVSDARVAIGRHGAAVTVHSRDPTALDRAVLEAQVRVAADLTPDATVALAVHPVAQATRPSPPRPPAWPLWLATGAVVSMGGACGLWWWSMRRRARGG